MKYKLIGSNNILFPIETVLENRGIENIDEFLKAGSNPNSEYHYSKLNNINEAAECIIQHLGGDKNVWVQVDPDV